jgi:integrative and conjugative element protein (TIGR02256 family)
MQYKTLMAVENGTLVIFPTTLIGELEKQKQLHLREMESGGIIIGKRRNANIEAVAITTPQIKDKRSRCRFERKEFGHDKILLQYWSQSHGEDNYLGEWHTHPEDFPRPSGTDLSTWKEMSNEHGIPLIVIIIGRVKNYYALTSKSDIYQLIEIT